MNTHPVHIILFYQHNQNFPLIKVRNQLQLIDSRTLDTELTSWCTRPVAYQLQDVAGDLFENKRCRNVLSGVATPTHRYVPTGQSA